MKKMTHDNTHYSVRSHPRMSAAYYVIPLMILHNLQLTVTGKVWGKKAINLIVLVGLIVLLH